MAHSTQSDPPEIRRKLEALQSQDQLIKVLSSRLLAAQLERDRLEKEIYEYRASIAPIRKCPEEVLRMIFERYLEENPRLIRRLLLVCWDWHDLAVTSPRLWTYIPITFRMDVDARSTCDSIERRVDQCLKLSGTLPLRLDLDFSGLTSSEDQIKCKLRESLEDLIGPDGQDALNEWILTVQVDTLDDPEIISACQLYHPFGLLERLIGGDGEVMARWESLCIDFPESPEISMAIVQHFTHPTPRLVSLVAPFDQEMWDVPGDPDQVVFPDLSSVEHLEVSRPKDLDLLSITPSSVTSLKISSLPHWNSSVFAPFTRLQNLEVYSSVSRVLDGIFFNRDVLCLPELQRLTIRGLVPNLGDVEFQVPVLDILCLSRGYAWEPRVYPKVQASQVIWTLEPLWSRLWKPHLMRPDLHALLLEYPSTLYLQVPSLSKEILYGIIRELKTQGTWSSALRSVTFEGETGILETIEVHVI